MKDQKTGQVEKPLKNALYNVGVLILLGSLVGVILVLLPFLKPLLWGVLFGAVLYPAKKKLSCSINSWIQKIEQNETPIILGILITPFEGIERLGEFITRWLITHIKVLFFGISSLIVLRMIIHFAPKSLVTTLLNIIIWSHTVFGKIVGSLNWTLVLLLLISYIITVCMLWNKSTSNMFMLAGQGLWILIAAYICSYLGAFQIPAFITILAYAFIGVIYEVRHKDDSKLLDKLKKIIWKEANEEVEEPTAPKPSSEFPAMPMGRLLRTKNQLSEIKNKMQLNVPEAPKCQIKSKTKESSLESDVYFKILFYACTATVLWKHLWIAFLCLIPIMFYSSKAIAKALGIWKYVEIQWIDYSSKIHIWLEPRKHALLPMCLPGVLQLNQKLHKFFCTKFKSFVDDISAIVMILILIVFVIFLGVFFFFQVYSETIAVAQLGSNLINRTLTLRPDLVEMLPINMQSLDNIIDNAYQHSRGTMEEYLDGIFNGTDPEQAKKLKIQILSVWDRLIQSYMDRSNGGTVGPRVPAESVLSTLDEIVTTSGGE